MITRNSRSACGCGKEFEKLEKILAWDTNKVREREDVKREAERNGITVHFANLMALCFIKNAELEKPYRNIKAGWC